VDLWTVAKTTQTHQRFLHRLRPQSTLKLILQVLQIATSTPTEVRAWRLSSAGSRLENSHDLSTPIVGVALCHFHQQAVIRSGPWDKDRNAMPTSQTLTTGDDLFDLYLDLVSELESLAARAWRRVVPIA